MGDVGGLHTGTAATRRWWHGPGAERDRETFPRHQQAPGHSGPRGRQPAGRKPPGGGDGVLLPQADFWPRSASRDTSHQPCSPRRAGELPPGLSPATTRAACVPAASGRRGHSGALGPPPTPEPVITARPRGSCPAPRRLSRGTRPGIVPHKGSFSPPFPSLRFPIAAAASRSPRGRGCGGESPARPCRIHGAARQPQPRGTCLDVPWLAFRLEKKKKGKREKK